MEVQALTLQIAETDLNAIVAKLMPSDSPLEDVGILVKPDGVCVKGSYPLLVNVAFESWWQIGIDGGKVVADLIKLKAFGMPGMIFKSAVLRALQELSAKEPWFEVKGERVHLDIEYLFAQFACPARLNLRSVRCGEGTVVVEAGRPQ